MKNLIRSLFPALLVSLLSVSSSYAGVGTDNPTGVAGEYNGSITTGGSYDPYTGNGKRFIDELTVTGAVGAYPLKWSRVLNTRGGGTGYLGLGGSWSHSYNWSLWVRPYEYYHHYPDQYEGPGGAVGYPDGRTLNFGIPDQPYTYDQDPMIGEPQDRLVHVGNGNFDLLMRDGGSVQFRHASNDLNNGWDLKATAIVDPYGQVTLLTYDSAGRLSQITEPGGRYLQINYTVFSDFYVPSNETRYSHVISSVQAFAAPGQPPTETVTYTYTRVNVWYFTYYYLTRADYDDGTHASYTYGPTNNGNVFYGVVQTCDDVRFAGPMKQIEYEYMVPGGPYEVSWGQIKREKNATTHQVVSEVTYPVYHSTGPLTDADFQRTETRGDGATRSFQYTSDGHGELVSYTDFKGRPTYLDFPNGAPFGQYRKSVTDARGNTTSTDMELLANAVMKVTHPDPEHSTIEFTYGDPNNPYFVSSRKDERGYITSYDRDTNNPDPSKRGLLLQTHYPDGSSEQFTYNGFGQVLTHKLRSGGTETFTYDTRGLKATSYPPATESDPDPWNHPTRYYYYSNRPNTDRLYMVIDPRNNATAYEYNQRGQVTKVQHQDGTYTQSGYNDDGTPAWTADENHPGAATDPNQRTSYTYDEYKRVLTVTNPMGETTTNYYGLDWTNPLLHTTNCVKHTVSPMGRNVVYDYDANLRKKYQTVAANTLDIATTFFDYDAVGNLTLVRDPRWYVTTYHYDERNRKDWMDDPIASDRNSSGHTMNWEYDGVGNKTKETRADGAFRSWDYDIPNRTTSAIDWRMSVSEPAITTIHRHDVQDLTEWVADAKGATYTFTFDQLHRKMSETYPVDAYGAQRTELYWYDVAGNLRLYKNPADRYKHLDYADSYDSRNRLRHAAWNSSITTNTPDWPTGQETITEYDAASRMTSITTNGGETTVAFGYDGANRQIWEDQSVAGAPTRRVETWLDADGNRTGLYVSGYYLIRFDHTRRNQLAHIYDGNWQPWFTYNYGAAGNVTKRQNVSGGVNDSQNTPDQWYDALNRPVGWENTWAGDGPFNRSWYQYDKAGREVATWRDEDNGQGSGRGERFEYEATNQLKNASYNAQNVWTGAAQNPIKTQAIAYPPDRLNRATLTENGAVTSYALSGMNQYIGVNGAPYDYDGNFNLKAAPSWSGVYDAESRLIYGAHDGNGVFFTYDGLGRCVKRTINGTALLMTYDGWKPILEWDGAGNFQAWNIYGPGADEILERYHVTDGHLRYHHDARGNVIAVLDGAGTFLEKYSYDGFGKPAVTDYWENPHYDANGRYASWYGNRFMFQGRERIGELGIYDYRHRMYHPDLGRFLQSDPTGFDAGDMNLFRYTGDDPVDGSDPTGLSDVSYVPDWDWQTKRDVDGRKLLANIIVASAHGSATYAANSNVTRSALGRSKLNIAPVPESMRLPMAQLVKDIKKLDKYTATIPIILEMCHAGNVKEANGKPCFAQQVANTFRTNPIWANPGDVDPDTGKGKTDPYILFTATAPPSPTGPTGSSVSGPSLGVGNAGSEGSVRRTFDAYGSTTEAAAQWESTWGPGGWLGIENRAAPDRNNGK